MTRSRVFRGVILSALALVAYWIVMFVATFEILGYPVRSHTLGWLGPTPRDRGCVVDIGKVHEWKCQDVAVFQQHALGCRLWLRLNGLTPG